MKEEVTQPLLESYVLGDLRLSNRVIMAPMTRCRADNKDLVPTALHQEYYQQRSGAGLIISEGCPVSEEAIGYVRTPGIFTKKQSDAWREVTDTVHAQGGHIFCQLWHCGRISHTSFHQGKAPLAPSAVNANFEITTPKGKKMTSTPQEMTEQDIRRTLSDFGKAAQFAKEAGFDGVEIHSSNGYLIHQFFNKNANQRTDAYGGTIKKRARFFFDVLDVVTEIWEPKRVGVRLNPSLHHLLGIEATEETIPTFDYVVETLKFYDLAYLHLSEPFTDVSAVPYLSSEIALRYRPRYKGTLIINSGFTQESGNAIIEAGKADLVAFGKPFISNPDLSSRFALQVPLTSWDKTTFYTTGAKGYTDYPALTVSPEVELY